MHLTYGDRYHFIRTSFFFRFIFAIRRIRNIIGAVLSLDFLRGYSLDNWFDSSLSPAIEKFAQSQNFDIVQAEYVYLSAALISFKKTGAYTVVDTHDSFANRQSALKSQGGRLNAWYSITEQDEAAGLSRADHALSISEADTKKFKAYGLGNVSTVDMVPQLSRSWQYQGFTIGFIGSGNSMNRAGLNSFLSECWPNIRAKFPQIRLKVAGSICESLKDIDGVEKLGRVKDLDIFFQSISFLINPVTVGTGLPIKVADSLSRCVPVVAAKNGCRGLDAFLGNGLIVAEEISDFTSLIIEIFAEPHKLSCISSRLHDTYLRCNTISLNHLSSILDAKHD